EFPEIHAANPIPRNRELDRRLPGAVAQTLFTNGRIGLSHSLDRFPRPQQTRSRAAIAAQAIDVQSKSRWRIGTDKDRKFFTSANARVRTVALDPRTAIFGLWIDARIR